MKRKDWRERAKEIKRWFPRQPFTQGFGLSLDYLGKNSARVSLVLCLKHCTETEIVTGGVHYYAGNAAAVSLAQMQTNAFTKLVNGRMSYPRPIDLKEGEVITAKAKFLEINFCRIVIRVEITSKDSKKIKAAGTYEYAIPNNDYRSLRR